MPTNFIFYTLPRVKK